jgi:hypothetical protein
MAEGSSEKPIRPRDWIILIFVIVVVGLLIAHIGRNVVDVIDRDQKPDSIGSASAGDPQIDLLQKPAIINCDGYSHGLVGRG